MFSPIDDLNLGLDYYNIDVKNMVSSPSLQQLIRGEQRGADVSGLITRDDNGDITAAIVKPINTGQLGDIGYRFEGGLYPVSRAWPDSLQHKWQLCYRL